MVVWMLAVAGALLSSAPASAQALPAAARAVLGDWVVPDDETGEPSAVVRLTEEGGVVSGRIVRVLPTREHPEPTFICGDCGGSYRGVDVRTIPLVSGMRWSSGEFAGGRIVDPRNGRTYRATMRLDGANRLRLRGFVGVRAFGRTETWERAR